MTGPAARIERPPVGPARLLWQWPMSVLFVVQMYLAMALMAVWFLPAALVSRDGAVRACRSYCRWVRFSARWMVGLRSEVRGTPPEGEVLIAAKHQSFFDIILIVSAVPRPRFIMKAQLRHVPILGWFARRIGCVPVDRGKRGAAISRMVRAVEAGKDFPGQLIIYPQGTRVPPGVAVSYKVGSAVLYQQLKQPCVPAAANVGLFWPRRSLLRRPGVAVVEFLDPIEPGLSKAAFMARIEHEVESRSNALMAEAMPGAALPGPVAGGD